jgi:aspartate aminotransferase-like enzyme
VDPDLVHASLGRFPNVKAVSITHCDTSTGVLNDVAAVCDVARRHGVLAMVDGVSSVGGVPFHFDAWQADVAVTATQKCLMCSPGLSFVALSDRAWNSYERATVVRNYWDFGAVRETVDADDPETPGTAPVHLVLQVRAALDLMLEEGLDNVFARHEAMTRRVRDWAESQGLLLQCSQLREFSPTLTGIATPSGVDPQEIRQKMRDRGILIARGIGPYRDSAVRIGHMGDIRLSDVERTLDALGDVLTELRTEPAVAVSGN